MIPKPDLKLFLGVFILSVILLSNAYDCCSGGGDEENETTEAPATEKSEAPVAETSEAPAAETTEVPVAGTNVTIGMISRHFKSSGLQALN